MHYIDDLSAISDGGEIGVYGLGSHIGSDIEILNIKLFPLLFEKLREYIFILLFFIELFTIFMSITILSVSYSSHILLMTTSGAI